MEQHLLLQLRTVVQKARMLIPQQLRTDQFVHPVEVTATSILAVGDTLIDELEKALDNDELVEIWEVNLAEKGTEGNVGKFKAKYFQGYLTECEITSNAEDMVEVSLTFGINGSGVDGYATVSQEQQEMANYVFADTKKTGA